MFGQRLERLHVIGRGDAGARPGLDGTIAQGEGRIGHDEIGLDMQLRAEPAAGGAGAIGIVEGEEPRLDLIDGEARDGAGEFLGEDDAAGGTFLVLLVGEFGNRDALGKLERGFEGIGKAGRHVGTDDDAVDDDIDIVLELLVEGRRRLDLVNWPSILTRWNPFLLQLGELLAIFALAPADDRERAGRALCPRAAPSAGRPSGLRSGSRSAGRLRANRARRRGRRAAADNRRSR